MHILKSPNKRLSYNERIKKGKMRTEKMEFGSKKNTKRLFHSLKGTEAVLSMLRIIQAYLTIFSSFTSTEDKGIKKLKCGIKN